MTVPARELTQLKQSQQQLKWCQSSKICHSSLNLRHFDVSVFGASYNQFPQKFASQRE